MQKWLIAHGYQIPSISSGASGYGYFGAQTKAAVQKYQSAHGIPSTGFVGPLTIASLNGLIRTETAPVCPQGFTCTPSASSPAGTTAASPNTVTTFTRSFGYGDTGADVKALQVYLNGHGFSIADSGAGSPGHETTYFGVATEVALTAFQESNKIDPATGYFGPKTKAVIAANP